MNPHHHHCAHGEAEFDQKSEGMGYSMEHYIDLDQVTVLNETEEGTGVKVFKKWENRLDKDSFVESDIDEELLFNIPFKGHVKITGIVIVGDLNATHPSSVKLYKDRPSMSFADTATQCDQEIGLKQDDSAQIDYALKASKFANITYLSLYFPTNFGSPKTRIHYIGLRGQYQCDFRQRIAMATYESRPLAKDHKGELPNSVQKGIF